MARPSWTEQYLKLASDLSARSTCIRRKYGAVIVSRDNRVVSTGYNGSAAGEDNCCDTGKCVRRELNVPAGERYELCVAVHAEMNAIINCNPADMKGGTLYIYGYNDDGTVASGKPCMMCARVIKNAKIKEVVYRVEENGVWRDWHTYL